MWLMMIAFVVIAIIMSVIVIHGFRSRAVEIGEVKFCQKVKANVINLEDAKRRHQDAQPPADRGRFGMSTPWRVTRGYQI
jgi:hypothetical protein